jgi:hypothetical protein
MSQKQSWTACVYEVREGGKLPFQGYARYEQDGQELFVPDVRRTRLSSDALSEARDLARVLNSCDMLPDWVSAITADELPAGRFVQMDAGPAPRGPVPPKPNRLRAGPRPR